MSLLNNKILPLFNNKFPGEVVSALASHAGGRGSQMPARLNSLGLHANAIGMVNGALIRYSISASHIHKAITFTALMPEKKPKL